MFFIYILSHLSSTFHHQSDDGNCWKRLPVKDSEGQRATGTHRLPAAITMSSVHLVASLPVYRLPVRGRHSKSFPPQRLSVLRAMRPVHRHFNFHIFTAMSVTLVFRWISALRILSRNSKYSSLHSFSASSRKQQSRTASQCRRSSLVTHTDQRF